ncbi:unnamed protein product, partial [marine sediment metagenome]
MAVRVDYENKTISLSVKDLAMSDFTHGSIVPESSFLPTRAALGRSIHDEHQDTRSETIDTYRREVTVKHEMDLSAFHVTIRGRIDGVYEHDGKLVIEEIKSVFNIESVKRGLEKNEYDAYLRQLQYYIWLLMKETAKEVTGSLVFIAISGGGVERVEVDYDEKALLEHLQSRVESIIEEAKLRHEWQLKQREFARKLEFP